MKKIVFLPLLFLIISGCNPPSSENKLTIEMVAFNSLSEEEQSLIPVSPKDSVIKKETVSNEMKSLIDHNYSEEQVYSVAFNDTATNTTGNLMVYVAVDKQTIVGKGFQSRD